MTNRIRHNIGSNWLVELRRSDDRLNLSEEQLRLCENLLMQPRRGYKN